MFDMTKEELIALRDITKVVDCSYNTIRRWSRDGVRSVGGKIVKLETIKTPSGRKTSVEAYYRFLRTLNEC